MLCYSTGSLPDDYSEPTDLLKIADLLSPSPFNGVELVVTSKLLGLSGEGKFWEKVRQDFKARGLTFRNVHLGSPFLLGPNAHQPGMASFDAQARSEKISAIKKSLSIAAYLHSPHLTLTTGLPETDSNAKIKNAVEARGFTAQGFIAQSEDETDSLATFQSIIQKHERILETVLAELIEYKPKDILLLIEQEPEHIIHSMEQLLAFGKLFPGEVAANFDIGHSEVLGENIVAAILKLGPLLRNVHFEDIENHIHVHKLYGAGHIDFDSIFKGLKQIQYLGDYTPDLYPFKNEPENAMNTSIEFFRKHLKSSKLILS